MKFSLLPGLHVQKVAILFLAVSSLFLLTFCSDKDALDDMENPSSLLELSKNLVSTGSSSGETEVLVKTSGRWTASTTNDWILVSPESGMGNTVVTIRWGENKSDFSREAVISFNTARNDLSLRILQRGVEVEVTDYSGKSAPTALKDTKYVTFNKPVVLKKLTANGAAVDTDEIQAVENGLGFAFPADYNEMGGEYEFIFTVEDAEGNPFTDTLTLNNFSEKVEFEGKIVQHFEHNGLLWVVTANTQFTEGGNRIWILSIDDLSVVQEIKLGHAPAEVSINPYNDKIYVIYSGEEKVDILNQNGVVEEVLVFNRNEFDIPGKPVIHPISMGFTQSGTGIVLFTANGNEQFRWKYVDSSNGHRVTSAEKDANKYNSEDFKKVVPNHDASKLFLTEWNLYNSLKMVDSEGTFKELEFVEGYYAPVLFENIKANRKTDDLFICGSYKQFIFNTKLQNGSKNWTLYHSLAADFSYLEGKENIIYGIDKMHAEFLVIDYSTSKLLFRHPVNKPIIDFGEHVDFFTTSNGRYVILSTTVFNSGTNSAILIFEKEMFL